ncbi:MAG TPA: cytochrome P450 [Marmoricola sp.]|nr:cytochrome P450 [Marmoricola sp.]
MTATISTSTGLQEPRGPKPGIFYILKMRRNPIGENDKVRAKYGEVIKINVFGTSMYACYGMDAAEQILINRDRVFANGPAWSHFIGPFFHRGLMLLDGEEHLHDRRIMQSAFTNDAMRRYHAVMVPHIRSGLAQWADVEDPRLFQLFKEHTLDLALEAFVGVELSREEQNRINKAFIAAVQGGTSIIRANVPGTPWARGLAARKVLEAFFYEHLPEKRRTGGDDLFAQLCTATSEDGEVFSDSDVVNQMIFLLMAAHDTTTITMSSMAYYLAKNPEWQEKARASALATGDDYDSVVGNELLERIMKEALRLCSPVPNMPRVATEEVSVNGYRIPKGAFVTVSPFYSHYDPAYWPDPTRFDPDRFAEPRREDHSHRMAFHGFGGGVHKCIGMYFAGVQVRAIFHELLRTYTWSVPEDYVWPLDLVALPFPSDRLPVTLEKL